MEFNLRIGYCESRPDFAFRHCGVALRNRAEFRALSWIECQILAKVNGTPRVGVFARRPETPLSRPTTSRPGEARIVRESSYPLTQVLRPTDVDLKPNGYHGGRESHRIPPEQLVLAFFGAVQGRGACLRCHVVTVRSRLDRQNIKPHHLVEE